MTPVVLRSIRTMTWRECCSWLTRVGIPVSRSPPTLIRTLKEGFVYQELVRKISPAYYVRHKVRRRPPHPPHPLPPPAPEPPPPC